MAADRAVNMVEEAYDIYTQHSEQHRQMLTELNETTALAQELKNFSALNIDVAALFGLEFIHYRIGKLPLTHFLQYDKFLAENESIIFHTVKRDGEFVWGLYFCPQVALEDIDALFSSLKFEVLDLPNTLQGTVAEILRSLGKKQTSLEQALATLLETTLAEYRGLNIACKTVELLYKTFDMDRFASVSESGQVFSFAGWIAEDEAEKLQEEIETDRLILLDFHQKKAPPTMLTNWPVIRQFEFFTKLYGLPQQGEIDPTPFLAVTYTILFGLMFGDVGHGLALAALGIFVGRKWHTNLGGILATSGTSALLVGFLYGSIFGFEDILPALWRRPMADISGTLMLAAGLGTGLIAIAILLSMYNAFRQKRYSDMLFSANGAAGLVFYSGAVFMAYRVFVQGFSANGWWLLSLPLVFVVFGRGHFGFSTFIELFETLLSYITNTISFVRVGAFAVSHAGMMHVVLQLSQTTTGTRNWLIVILGNVLVLAIEGLLVGIQVLRLDFYEMFNRFYTGGGQKFLPTTRED